MPSPIRSRPRDYKDTGVVRPASLAPASVRFAPYAGNGMAKKRVILSRHLVPGEWGQANGVEGDVSVASGLEIMFADACD